MQMFVVSAADEEFVPHYATMLHSAWLHNQRARFHLLNFGIKKQTIDILTEFSVALGIDLNITDIDKNLFHDFPIPSRSAAAYARLLIPELFPLESRALYIDADCLVLGSLEPLWNIDIGNSLIACAREKGLPDACLHGFEPEIGINSGVMLMNLSEWRRLSVSNSCYEFIRKFQPKHMDQTAINVIADGSVFPLDRKYNYLLHHNPNRIFDPNLSPIIVHSTGEIKFWLYRDALFFEIYVYHRKYTPFTINSRMGRWRSIPRIFFNLFILRKKYWRLILSRPQYKRFVRGYIDSIEGIVATKSVIKLAQSAAQYSGQGK